MLILLPFTVLQITLIYAALLLDDHALDLLHFLHPLRLFHHPPFLIQVPACSLNVLVFSLFNGEFSCEICYCSFSFLI